MQISLPGCLEQCQSHPFNIRHLVQASKHRRVQTFPQRFSHHAQIGANPNIDNAHFHTFTGLGQQLLPVLALGCAGTIDGTAGFFPKSVVHLYNLSIKNNATEAEVKERRLLQYKLSSVEELVVKFGTVGIKRLLAGFWVWGTSMGRGYPYVAVYRVVPKSGELERCYW